MKGNRTDRYHEWALSVALSLPEPLLTCEAVLAETAFHLNSVSLVMALIADGLIQPAFSLADNLEQIGDLAERYADRDPDLADLCVIRMSELYPKHKVVTVDLADFRVYRRNKREVIPLVCPPDT